MLLFRIPLATFISLHTLPRSFAYHRSASSFTPEYHFQTRFSTTPASPKTSDLSHLTAALAHLFVFT